MIIRHLHIDDFGCFHDFDLDLDDQLNCFSWPNEGGKSTCLEFIRRIFWGFPDKRSKLNPYPALKGSGHYGGFLDVITSKGEELRLERRGLRAPLKIISSDGTVSQVPNIGELSGISETFYRNVCAITIDELTAFSALDDTEIRNRLYGTALNIGPSSLSELQKELTEKAAELYKKKGTTHTLRKLSENFSESENRLAELSQILPAYEETVRKAEALEKEAALLRDELAHLTTREKELEELFALSERRRKFAEEEEKFAAQPPPPAVPAPLPPFAGKAPEAPPVPEFPALPPEPICPRTQTLEGKCDYQRAAAVETADFAEVSRWVTECAAHPPMEKFKIVPLLLAGTFLTVVCSAAIYSVGGAAAAAVTFFLCLLLGGAFLAMRHHQALRAAAVMDKRKESFVYKFLLDSQLPASEFPAVLADLIKFQKERQAYELSLAAYNNLKEKIDRSRFEYEVHRKIYDEKLREYESEKETYELKRRRHEEICRTAAAALARYEGEKLALIQKRNELPPAPELPPDPEELESLKEKIRELKQKLEYNCSCAGAERREGALLLKDRDCAVEVNVREQLRGKMRSTAEQYLILTGARKLLEKAVERCERKHQPELLQQASRWFRIFSKDAYHMVYKQLSTNTLRVSNPETKADKGIGELSRGTREVLFLALRLALIASFENSAEPLPVVLDDILVNLDKNRKAAVRLGIKEFAATHQVILFECQ